MRVEKTPKIVMPIYPATANGRAMSAMTELARAMSAAMADGHTVSRFCYGDGAQSWIRLVWNESLEKKVRTGHAYEEGQGETRGGSRYRKAYYMDGPVKVEWRRYEH